MLHSFDPEPLSAELANEFNELRVESVRSAMDIGELDLGVRTIRSFQQGDVVCVAVLESVGAKDAHSMTCVDRAGRAFDGIVSSPLRLFNHSCVPTLVMVPVPTDGIGNVSYVAIASVDIAPGDEVTFAYHQTEAVIVGFETCMCSGGDPSRCVGQIGGWGALTSQWREYYRGLFVTLGLPFPAYLP